MTSSRSTAARRKSGDEMHRAIDVLAKAMPNGQLMAAMGPLAFLGAAAERIKELEGLARDVLESFRCDCNDDWNPTLCDCGGDGAGELRDPSQGCWACQAYTLLHGYGKPPKDSPTRKGPPT